MDSASPAARARANNVEHAIENEVTMKRRSFIVGSFLAATAAANAGSANTGGPRSCAAAKPPAPAPRSILELNPPETILPMLQNAQMRAIKPEPHKPPVYQQEQLTTSRTSTTT